MIYSHIKREDIPEMKRIDLRMNEQEKYEIIKSLVDHNGKQKSCSH